MKIKPVAYNVVDADNKEGHATGQEVVEQSFDGHGQSPQWRSEERQKLIHPAMVTGSLSGVTGTTPPLATASGSSPSGTSAVGRKSPAAKSKKIVKDTVSGYNSGDEHRRTKMRRIPAKEWRRRDAEFAKCMEENGYELKVVEADGACLFRSISLQIYGDEGMHDVIRQHTMDYIQENREYFGQFVTEDIGSYIQRKRAPNAHGNHIEIQAISEIYSRTVEVYCYQATPINIFSSEQSQVGGYPPLRLSYQRGSHYNAILDPYNASVGVGLGLAGYKPQAQTEEALRLSEKLGIEQTMVEDKLKTTDLEATNEAIEEQIAHESYLEWCRDNMQQTAGGSATLSPDVVESDATDMSTTSSPSTAASVQRSVQCRTTLRKKRRRDEGREGSMEALEAPLRKSSKRDPVTPEADQQPCTSKQSSQGDAPSSSSNTYQELLEASLANDASGP